MTTFSIHLLHRTIVPTCGFGFHKSVILATIRARACLRAFLPGSQTPLHAPGQAAGIEIITRTIYVALDLIYLGKQKNDFIGV